MTQQTKRIVTVIAAFLGGLAIFSVAIFMVAGRLPTPIPAPSAIGGPFSLVDQTGKPVTEADLKGKPSLIFFGFTHCPDICPTALFDMTQLYKALGRDGDKVQAYFVSVDPERDTPDILKEYLSSFDPRLRGLTGNPAAVRGDGEGVSRLLQEDPARWRRLHHGSHRAGLSDGQGGPFRRALQSQAQAGRGGGGAEAVSVTVSD
jgi:protein SCO1/2